jgi:hypothetical protein
MQPGVDLVAALAQEHGASLPHGTALDDYLGASTRITVDGEAGERYRRWRVKRTEPLTVEGVDLSRIWELEMMAQCFLPAARMLLGLPLALAANAPQNLSLRHFDMGMKRLAREIAMSAGVTGEVASDSDSPAHDPIRGPRPLLAAAADVLGLPSRVKGEVVCMPYWSLYPVIQAIAGGTSRLRPVAARVLLPGLGRSRAISVAVRGGWIGVPSSRSRAASRRAVASALQAAGESTPDDPLDAAIDQYALETLGRIAGDTLAHVWHARGGILGRGVRLGVVPFDGEEHARMLLGVLRDAEVPALLVQHGFPARQGDPDMGMADHLAIWCEHERSLAPGRDPATVTVTGNPGAEHLAGGMDARRVVSGRSVVLVDYPGRLTASIDSRVGMRHVAAALEGLAVARPGTVAVIRPHPSDLAASGYLELAAGLDQLRIEIDAVTPIEALLGGADLCVGALSTACLQACALGVPTVLLDVAGVERPWPFDGSPGAIVRCADADALAEAISAALESREIGGRDAAIEALGVRPGAVQRVVDLVSDLAG